MVEPNEGFYKLGGGHRVIPAKDYMDWAKWFETADRSVGETVINGPSDEEICRVSTVFIGIDLNFDRRRPEVFETMVFGGPLNEQTYRTSTWEEAEQAHGAAIDECLVAIGKEALHEAQRGGDKWGIKIMHEEGQETSPGPETGSDGTGAPSIGEPSE